MKKYISVLLAAFFVLAAFSACTTSADDTTTADSGSASDTANITEDTAGTVTEPEAVYPSEADNFAGTAAYTVDGDSIVVDGVKYPNTKNMTNGVLYAVDDLGREVRTTGSAYVDDGSKNVGLFYFLWLGEHGDNGALDMTKIVEEGGTAAYKSSYSGWGPVGAMHFWGEPLYGYYYSTDKWVMRRHIEEFSLAGVDFLYFDATNGFPYISNAAALMKIIHEYNEQGFKAPKVVFYTHSNCVATVSMIYNGLYKNETYPDTWMYLDGKPLIIAYEDECVASLPAAAKEFFTYREPQWPDAPSQTRNAWPWMDFKYPQRVYKNKNKENETISVSVAQHSGTVCFSDSAFYGDRTNRGRSWTKNSNNVTEDSALYGYNFQQQWDQAIKKNVPYVLVTGWNEWVAQRQNPDTTGRPGKVVFIDTASMEFSRDIEPMRGGYFDNYYMQLTDNIRAYKGVAPTLVQDTRKVIDVEGSFDQWDDILVTYTDPVGDCENRRNLGFGKTQYKDDSGNNDLRYAKVTHDTKYLYFYIDVPETYSEGEENYITAYTEDTSWMQLFINVDTDASTGFYGFDYILNYTYKDSTTSTIAKSSKDGKEFAFEESGEVKYKIEGNKMMLKVSLEDLGITDYSKIKLAFKWVDSDTKITTMEQMYTDGDCAPHGRFCYIFQNYK